MLKFFKALKEAIRIQRREELKEKVKASIFDDPISIELIEGLAKHYAYHFEVISKDGTTYRFYKRGATSPAAWDDSELYR